ncbi:hypothetical protein GCM10025868_11910 [Angustibacter aerolatus]|uniref:Glucose-6-phosphate dehydrogenase C-terminal domain-containing protein n=1 Tax=Angustibacter aerolatus TaxID=1162965 RepID=A0ABQ6JGN9_9ACTN|nr:hypothetical protein GCM10025868_11910 [Angustibacter aerolatus]
MLEAYERLIYDAMRGDHTLFTTAEGIERLWEVSTPLLENMPSVRPYHAGSWGPNAIHQARRTAGLAPAVRARVAQAEPAGRLKRSGHDCGYDAPRGDVVATVRAGCCGQRCRNTSRPRVRS